MMATEPRMPAAAISRPSPEIATAMTGVLACLDLDPGSPAAKEVDLAVRTGGGDLAVGGDRHGVERGRQRGDDRRSLAAERRDAQRRVVAGGDERVRR